MRGSWISAALTAALAVGGCTNAGVLSVPYYRGSYQPGETGVQSSMPVVVRGNPFAAPNVDVGAAVADAMQGHAWWPTRFVPSPVDPQSSYRVVVLFSPPLNFAYPYMCSAAVLPSGPQEKGRVPVSAALCKWDVLMAAASGYVDAPAPDDPRFRAGMAGFARALFPAVNPDDASRDGSRVSLRF